MSLFPIKRGWKPKKGNGDSIKRKRGRPTNQSKRIETTVKAIRITPFVSELLDFHKQKGETYSQEITRLLGEKGELTKKVDALEQELLEQQLVKQHAYESIPKLVEVTNK